VRPVYIGFLVKAYGDANVVFGRYLQTGKVTVKKGTKAGTYKLKVKVKAAGTSKYKSKTQKVTITIWVKK